MTNGYSVRIEELHRYIEVNVETFTENGCRYEQCTAFMKKGVKECIELTFSNCSTYIFNKDINI